MTADATPWHEVADGILLDVRLTPRSAKDAIDGVILYDGRCVLLARVRAKPVEGEANAALIRLVAEWLGVAKSTVALDGGGKSRIKTLHVAGDPERLSMALRERAETAG